MSEENKSLFSLALQLESLLAENEGKITEEINQLIQVKESEIAHKLDSYYFVIQKMKAAAAFYKTEADKLTKMKRACETLEDSLKSRLKEFMAFAGTKEIQGSKAKFTLCNAQPKLVITNEALIPKKYQKVVVTINKEELGFDLSQGVKVEGAHLEQNSGLRSGIVNPSRRGE